MPDPKWLDGVKEFHLPSPKHDPTRSKSYKFISKCSAVNEPETYWIEKIPQNRIKYYDEKLQACLSNQTKEIDQLKMKCYEKESKARLLNCFRKPFCLPPIKPKKRTRVNQTKEIGQPKIECSEGKPKVPPLSNYLEKPLELPSIKLNKTTED